MEKDKLVDRVDYLTSRLENQERVWNDRLENQQKNWEVRFELQEKRFHMFIAISGYPPTRIP